MSWLTDDVLKSAQSSWLVRAVPKEKISAVLRLLDYKDAVSEVHGESAEDLAYYFAAASAYRNQACPNRASVATFASAESSAASSVFSASAACRDSLHSNLTNHSDTSTTLSTLKLDCRAGRLLHDHGSNTTQTRSSPSPASATRFHHTPVISDGKPYHCQTCRIGFKRRTDLSTHVKHFCENQKRFKCHTCDLVDRSETVMNRHCLSKNHLGFFEFCLPVKAALGCSYCRTCHYDVDAYIRCAANDQERNPTASPQPNLRLKALLQQNNILKSVMGLECQHRRLPHNAWISFVWNDDKCDKFAEKLEYGIIDPEDDDDVHKLGVPKPDVGDFIKEVFAQARLGSGMGPIPPAREKFALVPAAASNLHATTPPNPATVYSPHAIAPHKSVASTSRAPNAADRARIQAQTAAAIQRPEDPRVEQWPLTDPSAQRTSDTPADIVMTDEISFVNWMANPTLPDWDDLSRQALPMQQDGPPNLNGETAYWS